MRKLDRYIYKELFVPFLVGTLAVALMFMANQLMYIMQNFNLQNVPMLAIAQMILYKTPFWLNMTLPVGMSLAASLGFSRLARESELTAVRAAGTKIMRVVRPAIVFGILVAIGNFLLVERVMPPAEREFNRLQQKVVSLGVLPNFASNRMITLKNATASLGTISRLDDDRISITQILLVERPRVGETFLLTAENGIYDRGVWTFNNTRVWRFVGDDLVKMEAGKPTVINEKIVIADLFGQQATTERSLKELKEAIDAKKRLGQDSAKEEIDYHTRFSVPAACIIFAIVAPVFALWFARTGGFFGVLLSIILVFAYYNTFIVSTEIIGRNGWLTPVVSAWLPNIIFGVLGLIGIRRLE